MKYAIHKIALICAVVAAGSWHGNTITKSSLLERFKIKRNQKHNLVKQAPVTQISSSQKNTRPSVSSQRLSLLRTKKNSLEVSLDKTDQDIESLHSQVPDLEKSRLETVQRIDRINRRMQKEKGEIAKEILKRATAHRQLREAQKHKDMAVAQAKMLYLKNYGKLANPRTHKTYRQVVKKIKDYGTEIKKLQGEINQLASNSTTHQLFAQYRAVSAAQAAL